MGRTTDSGDDSDKPNVTGKQNTAGAGALRRRCGIRLAGACVEV